MNNPYFLSALSGFSVYIIAFLIKKSGNKEFDKSDIIKLSLFVVIATFLLLNFYEKAPNPVLKEPFISSFES